MIAPRSQSPYCTSSGRSSPSSATFAWMPSGVADIPSTDWAIPDPLRNIRQKVTNVTTRSTASERRTFLSSAMVRTSRLRCLGRDYLKSRSLGVSASWSDWVGMLTFLAL